MLKSRRYKNFKAISVHEPGFSNLPPKVIQRYQLDRDFDALPVGDINPTPTVFECRPLDPDDDRMVDPTTMPSNVAQRIFKKYVVGVIGFDDEKGRCLLEWEGDGADRMVTDKAMRNVTVEIYQEISLVIIQMAKQDTTPFLPLLTSQEIARTQIMASLVKSAAVKAASDLGKPSA